MRRAACLLSAAVLGSSVLFCAAGLSAQQTTISTPQHTVSDSFFEHMGTSWGLRGDNWFFNFGGGPTQAAPPLGGFDPSAGANFGFGFNRGGMSGFFNGNWSQGNRRSFTGQAPMVTVTSGFPGYFGDMSVTPFVTGVVPVVGGYPSVGTYRPAAAIGPSMVPSPGSSGVGRDAVVDALQRARAERRRQHQAEDFAAQQAAGRQAGAASSASRRPPSKHDDLVLIGPGSSSQPPVPGDADAGQMQRLTEAQASSAGRPALSVAEARRLHAREQAEQNEEARVWVDRGRVAEAEGKPNVAKVYYHMAARRASGELRKEILARIESLRSPPRSPSESK